MEFLKCLLFMAGLSLAVCDYAKYEQFVRQQANNATFVRLFEKHMVEYQKNNQMLKAGAADEPIFHCKAFSQPKDNPTSVHKLRAMDIKVIAALGDSITAGTGITAQTVLGLLRQDRGLSWSIGGDKTIAEEETLPNMMKTYNSEVKGFSTGWGSVDWEWVSHLNLANPGDKSQDIPGQAEKLVARMKADDTINMDEDWKMITLFVGGNDLCDFCGDKETYKAENYVAHLQTALDHLHANVPRAFVNLVNVMDISIVKKLNENLVCDTLHLFLCSCAAFPRDSEAEAELQAETARYRKLTEELILSGRYDTSDDFTVMVQPFFTETAPPKKEGSEDPDLSYFAPDCFHLSLKGHRAAADALWNNMIEPVGSKRTAWKPGEQVDCPSAAAPYFYTYKNSPSQSFGGFQNNNVMLGAPAPKTQDQSGSHSSAITTVAIVAGALLAVAVTIFGIIKWRKWNRLAEEREILLKPRDIHVYN